MTGIDLTADGDSLTVTVAQPSGTDTVHARNVVLSTGLVPRIPTCVVEEQQVWHSSRFLDNYRAVREPLRRVGVVGAGQSAAELVRYLDDHLAHAEIFAFLPSCGYSAADSTPFANRVFDPAAMDDFYFAPARAKSAIWQYHKNTNYSVVAAGMIEDLHLCAYDDETSGRNRLHFRTIARVLSAKPVADGARVVVHSMLSDDSYDLDLDLDVDVLICATVHDPMDPSELLGELNAYSVRDEEGRHCVGRDHRLITAPHLSCGIYLQGGTEHRTASARRCCRT